MLEKLVYFISSFSLFFWTIFSNKKTLEESIAYLNAITILLAVEFVVSIICEEKKNQKKRQVIYIMLFLLNVGAAVSYCASNCKVFANDLIYLILTFVGVYLLTCYTDWYQSKNLGFIAMLAAPLALIGALFGEPVNGAHIKVFGILILPLVVLLYQTAICWFLKGRSRGYLGGKVGSLSSKNIGFLCYTMFLFLLIAMCNEFNLLILIALLGTAFFWYKIPDLKIRMAYIGLCLGTAFWACKSVSHIRARLEVWLDLSKAVTDENLVGKTESITYFLKNIQRSGWWGIGPGSLSVIFKTTCDTDHALTRVFYDYGILMGILVVAAAVLLIKWMTTIRTLDTMEEFWTLGSIIVTGTILLLHIGSNTGGFISAGVSLPLASRGLCLNAMFVSYIAVELGFIEKGEKRNVQKKRKTSRIY